MIQGCVKQSSKPPSAFGALAVAAEVRVLIYEYYLPAFPKPVGREKSGSLARTGSQTSQSENNTLAPLAVNRSICQEIKPLLFPEGYAHLLVSSGQEASRDLLQALLKSNIRCMHIAIECKPSIFDWRVEQGYDLDYRRHKSACFWRKLQQIGDVTYELMQVVANLHLEGLRITFHGHRTWEEAKEARIAGVPRHLFTLVHDSSDVGYILGIFEAWLGGIGRVGRVDICLPPQIPGHDRSSRLNMELNAQVVRQNTVKPGPLVAAHRPPRLCPWFLSTYRTARLGDNTTANPPILF